MVTVDTETSKTLPNQKKKRRRKRKNSSSETPSYDPMSECVTLCQQNKWREALMLCRRECHKAREEGNEDLYLSLHGAQTKVEYSLRRQMAAVLLNSARDILAKEYLLDVGE
ncbi:MAG: hypothetical protein ACOCZS_04305 [Verrucomicrobiota bacterium]